MSESNALPSKLTERTTTQLKHPTEPPLDGEKCWKCDKPAIARCPEDQFPTWCGKPECDEHPHEFERHGPPSTAKQSALERLEKIKQRYSGTAGPRATYEISADDLAWLINEIDLARVSGDVATGEVPALDSADDYELLVRAVQIAREVQEFIWAGAYPSLRPYDAEGWRKLFQKRVDCIAEVDLTRHGGLAALRKRLLQQAALSVKALALVNRWVKTHPLGLSVGSDGSDLTAPAVAQPTEGEQRLPNAERLLAELGYSRCTAAACNCNSYHRTDEPTEGAQFGNALMSAISALKSIPDEGRRSTAVAIVVQYFTGPAGPTPATPDTEEDKACSFCGETGFDLVGLKSHLLKDCEVFENTERTTRL